MNTSVTHLARHRRRWRPKIGIVKARFSHPEINTQSEQTFSICPSVKWQPVQLSSTHMYTCKRSCFQPFRLWTPSNYVIFTCETSLLDEKVSDLFLLLSFLMFRILVCTQRQNTSKFEHQIFFFFFFHLPLVFIILKILCLFCVFQVGKYFLKAASSKFM